MKWYTWVFIGVSVLGWCAFIWWDKQQAVSDSASNARKAKELKRISNLKNVENGNSETDQQSSENEVETEKSETG